MNFIVKWIDGGREPQCAPDPAYPNGRDLSMALASAPRTCTAVLPYPAKRCGYYEIECTRCGLLFGVSTAGRPDDPRSARVACKPEERA